MCWSVDYKDGRNDIDLKIITGRSDTPVLIIRSFGGTKWCAYFEHEGNTIATYDGISPTPEEAIRKFIKYRINKEPIEDNHYMRQHEYTNV